MAENEDLPPPAISLRIPLRPNVIASFTLPQECDLGSAPLPLRRDDPAKAIHRGLVDAGRFHPHKSLKKPRHRGCARPQPFEERQHLGSTLHRAAMLATHSKGSNSGVI